MNDDNTPESLAEFTAKYCDGSVVLDLDVRRWQREHDDRHSMIILRCGEHVVVIDPMDLGTYLNIDLHPFVDGEAGQAGVIAWADGMADEVRSPSDRRLVAVMVNG